jgi:hypothetical protein
LEHLEQAGREAWNHLNPSEDGLCGSLGFALECSVLTPELAIELEATVRPDVMTALRELAETDDRLSSWLDGEPQAETIATRCLEYARQRVAALGAMKVDDLLVRRFPERADPSGLSPSGRSLADALRGLVTAAAPFLKWDESRLRGLEYEALDEASWLGLADGAGSPLAETVAGLGVPLQLLATHDPTRVVAVRMVRGVPLEAVEN